MISDAKWRLLIGMVARQTPALSGFMLIEGRGKGSDPAGWSRSIIGQPTLEAGHHLEPNQGCCDAAEDADQGKQPQIGFSRGRRRRTNPDPRFGKELAAPWPREG
jgi:hypothetical protein